MFVLEMRFAALALLGLATIGCGSVEVSKPRYYRLEPLALERAEAKRPYSLRVGVIAVAPHLDSERLVSIYGEHRVDPSDEALWAAPLGRLVTASIEQGLRDAGVFATVLAAGDPSPADLELAGSLTRFERRVDASGEAAHAEIRLTLRDGRTGRVLWQARLDESARISSTTDASAVAALNTALALAFSRFVPRAEEEGGFRAAAAVPRK